MKRPKLSRELLTLAILTVMTVFTWMSFEIYRTLSYPAPLKIPQEQLEPLEPKLNLKVIEDLTKKETVSLEELNLTPPPSVATMNEGLR